MTQDNDSSPPSPPNGAESPTPPKKTDEKGLTLSGRTILRLFHEFNRALAAGKRVGDDSGFEMLLHPTMLVEIKALLWIAHGMNQRIGKDTEVQAYLREHEAEDVKTIEEGIGGDATAGLIDKLTAIFGVCEKCKKMKCPVCRRCHACDGKTESVLH